MYAQTVVNLKVRSIDRLFSYSIPEKLEERAVPGAIAAVPFGKRILPAFIFKLSDELPCLPEGTALKSIEDILLDASSCRKEIVYLAQWLHDYYGCSFIDAVKTVIPPCFYFTRGSFLKNRKKIIIRLIETDQRQVSLRLAGSPRQAELADRLFNLGETRILRDSSMPLSLLYELEKKGIIGLEDSPLPILPAEARRSLRPYVELEPSLEQKAAFEKAASLIDGGRPAGVLLYGAPGSGKTLVYLKLIDYALSKGKTALVLVPELSLMAQFADIYRSRFGDAVAFLHSSLSNGERVGEWRRILNGDAKIVLGTRSAVFAPLKDIGVIIIDEEHEPAYKQDSSPRYHARHVAVKRAAMNNSVLVLGTATPSLETYFRAKYGGYALLYLSKRVSGYRPKLKIIDMRRSFSRKEGALLSPWLLKRLDQTLKAGLQALLFINRRGFFRYLFCADCGKRITCPNCAVTLKLHKNPSVLKCHYCAYEDVPPDFCESCGSFNIVPEGGGTQRLEDEIKREFPGARVLRMDRDTVSAKHSAEKIYDAFRNNEADILIGTQMITKGFDFPNVALSAMVLADAAFSMPDFRAQERAWQLMVQVAGRAGRKLAGAEFAAQTYDPLHPALRALSASNPESFYNNELADRKELGYPPFGHLVRILFLSKDKIICSNYAEAFAKEFFLSEEEDLLGPSPCPVEKIKNYYRVHIYIKCRNVIKIVEQYRKISEKMSSADVNSIIDSDPLSYL